MEQISTQKTLHIPTINKSVVVYQYGQSDEKVCWFMVGRNAVVKRDALLKVDCSTIGFDTLHMESHLEIRL
jgi:hypothetical protein